MKQEDRNICLPVPRVIDGWPWIVFNTDGGIKFVAMLRAFGPSLRSRRLFRSVAPWSSFVEAALQLHSSEYWICNIVVVIRVLICVF